MNYGKKYTTTLLKIDGIAGILYSNEKPTQTIVVYGIGAPLIPDNGSLPDAPQIMSYRTDLFVPDYIGYCRSDGIFTPRNCIKTFLKLYTQFVHGCTGTNHYAKIKKRLFYKRVVFIGRSFGGTYVPLLPRFNPQISELCILCPAVDNRSCGSVAGEETNKQFMDAMLKDGYHYLYRGIRSRVWLRHLNNKDGLSPMDNINYLDKARLFIAHGKKDRYIHYSKSVIYYNRLLQQFPHSRQRFLLRLYPRGDHSPKTTNKAVVEFLNWLKLERL